MVKTKTSIKQKKSLRNTSKKAVLKRKSQTARKFTKMSIQPLTRSSKMKIKESDQLIEYSPTEELLDEQFIALAIWECLKNNDPEGVVEIIQAHLEAINKVKTSKEENLSKLLRGKSKNPTIKNLAELVHSYN